MQESEKELQSEVHAEEESSPMQDTAETALDTIDNTSQEPLDTELSPDQETNEGSDEPSDLPVEAELTEEELHTVRPPSNLPCAVGGFVIPKVVKIVGLAVIVLAAVAFGAWIGAKQNDPWRIESGLADYGGFSSESGSTDQIVIPGYGEILLTADTRDVMLILPNPPGNPCYFRFSILLKEGNEVIYTSGLVPPGKAIEELRLKRELAQGDYPAIIQIETFSLDGSLTPMNGANVETVLNLR